MRRLLPIIAAAALLATLPVAGGAMAREHGGRGDHGGHGGQPACARGGGRGPERAMPPAYRDGGRWERQAPPPEAYGPPPGAYAPRPYGYGVRRGGYLPPQMRGGVVEDYGRYRLRPPPPGYGWVRSGRSLMLMDMGTGQVFDVIPY